MLFIDVCSKLIENENFPPNPMFAAGPRKKDTRKDTNCHFQRVLTSKRTLIDTFTRELICTAQYDHFRDTILGGEVGKKSKTALVMA